MQHIATTPHIFDLPQLPVEWRATKRVGAPHKHWAGPGAGSGKGVAFSTLPQVLGGLRVALGTIDKFLYLDRGNLCKVLLCRREKKNLHLMKYLLFHSY